MVSCAQEFKDVLEEIKICITISNKTLEFQLIKCSDIDYESSSEGKSPYRATDECDDSFRLVNYKRAGTPRQEKVTNFVEEKEHKEEPETDDD